MDSEATLCFIDRALVQRLQLPMHRAQRTVEFERLWCSAASPAPHTAWKRPASLHRDQASGHGFEHAGFILDPQPVSEMTRVIKPIVGGMGISDARERVIRLRVKGAAAGSGATSGTGGAGAGSGAVGAGRARVRVGVRASASGPVRFRAGPFL
jgi:hypothetical protein